MKPDGVIAIAVIIGFILWVLLFIWPPSWAVVCWIIAIALAIMAIRGRKKIKPYDVEYSTEVYVLRPLLASIVFLVSAVMFTCIAAIFQKWPMANIWAGILASIITVSLIFAPVAYASNGE